MAAVCVYCSSSRTVDACYVALARSLGDALARRGDTLVFGGTDIGLMGALAHAARAAGGRIVGVVPELIRGSAYVFPADDVVFTPDLRARKAEMEQRADAFVAMPGGFGTLDEVLDVLVHKQLAFHRKPIVLLDHGEFYRPLAAMFERLYREGFASAIHHREMYRLVPTLDELFAYLTAYRPIEVPLAWS